MLTNFGRVLRKIRIDLGLTLKTMADATDLSSAYLSAVEVGRKPLSSEITNKIYYYLESKLNVPASQLRELQQAAAQDMQEVRIGRGDKNDEEFELVVAFARKIESSTNLERLKRLLAEE